VRLGLGLCMTGNARFRARLGRLGQRDNGQNKKHNHYGTHRDIEVQLVPTRLKLP